MKNLKLFTLPGRSLLFVALAGLVFGMFGSQAFAGTIVGTAHDFSGQGYSGGEICVVCHTPHTADVSVADAPLWNHALTTKTFVLYDSPSLDAIPGQPDEVSKLCLSCHDGTVAIDSFGGATGSNFVTGDKAVGAGPEDLTNDHPISFVFDTALVTLDPGLHEPTTATVTIGQGGDKTRTGTVSELMLSGTSKVQCNSCHDVHNGFTVPGPPGEPFLKVTKAGSQLCLTCHNK